MRQHSTLCTGKNVLPVLALSLLLAACAQPAPQSAPTTPAAPSPSATPTPPPGAKVGTPQPAVGPACELVTAAIAAARIGPGLTGTGQQEPDAIPGPSGSPIARSFCSYYSKTSDGYLGLTVGLVPTAPAELLAQTRQTPSCLPVAGVGDFACELWSPPLPNAPMPQTGVQLVAVRGTSTLTLSYTASGAHLPDLNSMGTAVASLAIDAGWGNGNPVSVPPVPASASPGPPSTANAEACGYVSAETVQKALGANMAGRATPSGVGCSYIFGGLGIPGPNAFQFDVVIHKDGALGQTGPGGTPISGIGDAASLQIFTPDPTQTTMAISAVKGKDTANFIVRVTLSPSGPSIEQFKEQFINLVRTIDF